MTKKMIWNFIETLTTFIQENKTDEKVVTDLQQLLRSSRWNKQVTVGFISSCQSMKGCDSSEKNRLSYTISDKLS